MRGLKIQTARPAVMCIQCQYYPEQRRHFADEKRNSTPASSSTEPIHLGAPPEQSAQSSSSPSSSAEPAQAAQPAEAEPETQAPPPPHPPKEDGELPSATELRRSHLSKRLTHLMDNLQGSLFLASQHINDLTGYTGIEALKRAITTQESALSASQDEVRVSRQNYKQLVADRAASQREVTTLLARKDTWTPIDLERFTSLYRSDHGNEHAVQEAAQRLADAEREAEKAASRLNSSILARYHEEQIWSDKIRRMSTWGTWGLMGVNVLLFLVFQFGFEPWRRERLTRGFEDKVRKALEKEREMARIEDAKVVFDDVAVEGVVQAAVHDIAPPPATEPTPEVVEAIEEVTDEEVLEAEKEAESEAEAEAEAESTAFRPISARWDQPATWREGLVEPCVERVQDLFSERKIEVRKQDVTMAALEGLATGAAVAGLCVMYILRPN